METKKKSYRNSVVFSTILVMIGLVFTKGSGFLRDIFVSIKFSEDVYRDSFTLAFTIPDLFYNLLVGGAIFSTVTPYLSGQIAIGEEKKGMRTTSIFISVVSVVMITVCTLGTIFSKPIYSLYALKGGIDDETLELASSASRMLFPQIFFIMLAALSIGILNSYKRFSSTAFAPSIYNFAVLVSILIFAGNSKQQLVMTTGGILLASIVYAAFQYLVGRDKLSQIRFIFKPKDPDFIALFKRAIPILISSSIIQINVVILNYFAGQFDSGSIYGFRNASTIWQIPYGIFTVAITTVMTPMLAGYHESKKYEEASKLLSARIKSALFLMIPSAFFMAVLSVDVVKAIYQWTSSYTDTNAKTASTFLLGFTTAIITASVAHLFNQAFYAIGQTKIPLLAGTISLFLNPLFCQALIMLGVGPMSLSIAYSITNFCQMIILTVLYFRRKELAPHNMLGTIIKCFVAAAIMTGIVFVLDQIIPAQGGKITQLLIISLKGAAAVAVYFITALIFKMEETTFWIDRFKTKLKGIKSNK